MSMSPENVQRVRASVIVVLPLIGFVVAVFLLWNKYVFWQDMALLAVMYTITILGIGIGYHRMLTHQGFNAPNWLRGMFLIFGNMAWEGAPLDWAATHVKHHAHSDEEDDPHSPLHGFWHAHIGWLFDRHAFAKAEQYAPHLLEDPVVVFVDRYSAVWMTLALAIPFALGGWTGFLWAGIVRIFLTTHVTWSVNSICHCFGHRAFETTDESRNEWVIGLLAFGEGWHNNHHAFPQNAFHGMRWWQFDLSGLIIRFCEKVGLMWDVQRVGEETLVAHHTRATSMIQSIQDLRAQVMQSATRATQEVDTLFSGVIDASLQPEEYARLKAFHASAIQRLTTIRAMVTRATHTKRPKLQQYLREVQDLVQQAKEAAGRRAGMMTVQH